MRQLLDVLRTPGDAADVRSRPGLGDLDELIAGFGRAGIEVALVRRGDDGVPLPDVLDLCCYRLVEEALTNVARHSGARRADVVVERRPDCVVVEVSDTGPPRPTGDGTGRGVTGMRERVALLGGTVEIGPRAAGGFAVRADVPVTPLR